MEIGKIIDKVEKVSSNTKYRFIRTEKGKLFEQFTQENHVAIGWDYITLHKLKSSSPNEIKEQIAKREDLNIDSPRGKSASTLSYNKLMMFLELSKGDIVICPSRNSDWLAFGQIIDDKTFEDVNAERFLKRRKVKWFKIIQMDDLNPIFYQVKSNHHTISSVDRFAPHIDRVIGNLYQKHNNTHYVLNVGKEENISFDELNDLMDNVKKLLVKINLEFSLEENPEEFYIKINLQSKGALELIKSGKSLAVLAFILSITSCTNADNPAKNEQDSRIDKFMTENRELLNKTTSSIDSLRINTEELTKPFKNGN